MAKTQTDKKKGRGPAGPVIHSQAIVLVAVAALLAAGVLAALTGRTFGQQAQHLVGGIPVEGNVEGYADAPITMIEYADFQCPFCGQFARTTEGEIEQTYVKTHKVKIQYMNIAFLGQESLWASEAAECAGDQGQFWEYHNILFQNQKGENKGAFSRDNLVGFANQLKLDPQKFTSCLDSGKYVQKISDNTTVMRNSGIKSTPTFLINGQLVNGAQPFSVFQGVIEAELKKKP